MVPGVDSERQDTGEEGMTPRENLISEDLPHNWLEMIPVVLEAFK